MKSVALSKKLNNRCPDCGKPVKLRKKFFSCHNCGCSGYFLLDVELWNKNSV